MSVTPEADSSAGDPGAQMTYDLTVTNTGNMAGTFTSSLAGNAWITTADPDVLDLESGASESVTVTVEIPAGAAGGDSDTVEVTFTSDVDPGKSAASHMATRVNPTITASAGAGGTIDPVGDVPVYEGDDQAFDIIADPGWEIADVVVDGASVGAVSSYTFENVQDDHTIPATFSELPPVLYKWYLAEGSTEGGMETYVLVQNPGDQPAQVTLTFMTSDGVVDGPTGTLAPGTRDTWKVNDYVLDWNVSTMVASDQPVVAERAMYGNDRTWAHDSIGVSK